MKKSYFISIALISFILYSCSDSDQDNANNRKSEVDTVVTEIPSARVRLFKGIQWEARRLGLDSLPGGFDSLQIRIWLSGRFTETTEGRMDDRQVLIISYKPLAEVLLMTNTWKLGEDSGALIKSDNRALFPQCGWRCFADSLTLFKIEQMSDESQLKIDAFDSGKSLVYIEIAKHKYYKIISITTPRKNLNLAAEYITLSSFLAFLERQLKFTIMSDRI